MKVEEVNELLARERALYDAWQDAQTDKVIALREARRARADIPERHPPVVAAGAAEGKALTAWATVYNEAKTVTKEFLKEIGISDVRAFAAAANRQ